MGNSGDFSIGSKVWPGTSKLIEEMGELQQVLGKLMGTAGQAAHWDGTDLRERLIDELADLQAAINFFQGKNLTTADDDRIERRRCEKLHTFCAWHEKQVPLPEEPA